MECEFMKKKSVIVIAIIVVFAGDFLLGTGFQKRTDVILVDYSVTDDGKAINLVVKVPVSTGYVRGFQDKSGGVKPHYLTFYNTFGGFNSSFGAKDHFILELNPDDTEIYFNRPDNGYELVLQKDSNTGEWMRPTE